MIYNIFGKNIQINIKNSELKEILLKELEIYGKGDIEKLDYTINFIEKIELSGIYSNTPSIHKTLNNGFFCDFGICKVLFTKVDNLKINVEYKASESYLSKFRSIMYRNSSENIGQVLHELIFIPLNFFDKERTIIHSSSMKNLDTNRTLMIGGTGGVGKTSLELLLCRELNYSFISDDIAVVDNKGLLYPNLAFPKIYAYNVIDNKELKNVLFMNRTVIDKMQWDIRKKLRGNSSVRRSISPQDIFKSIETSFNKIDDYYILFKTNEANRIIVKDISSEMASEMTLEILKNEYHSVFQHITWHEYNCRLMGYEPVLRLEDIFSNWKNLYNKIFTEINCKIVKIPLTIKHQEFLKEMKSIF